MADANIDILTIDVKVETKDAKKDIKDLESTLEKVGSKTTGRKGAENPFDAMGKSAEETSKKVEDICDKLDGLTTALGRVETAFNNAANARSNFTGGKKEKSESEDELALEYKRLKAIEKREKMEAYVDKKSNPDSTEAVYERLKAEDKYQKMLDYIASKNAEAQPEEARTSMLDSIVTKAEAAKNKIKELYAAIKPLAKVVLFPFTKPFQVATNAVTAFGRSIGKLLPALKRVAVYRAIRFALKMITNGFREGTQNAYQWSKALGGTFAASMDTLATSSLYLKNSLGALATPLINAVAPAIDFLIDKFVALLNVANQVIALLTGAKTWTKAIKYPKEYAAAANDAAGGAGKLAKAMTTILAIDELNPLNGDKGGGGGGGGGSGNALDYSQMFEEQTLAASWLDSFKNAWENGDFTSIGETFGNKINEALESIPWDRFQATANNIASSLATFLNGAISSINWNLVGNTVAQGMNTLLGFFKTYAEKFDFSAAGAAIGQAISGWAQNFRWADFGTTISLWAKGLLDLLVNAIENIDWYALGSGLSEAIKNIDWADFISRAFRLIGSLVGAFSSFIEGLLSDFKEAFEKFWDYDTLKESGTDTWEGFLNGIVEGIKGIGRWIYDNIFEPFITGIKNAFGIHSPSTVMEEQGGYVMDGFLNGLTNGLSAILEFFGGLVSTIAGFFKDPIGTIKVAVDAGVEKAGELWNSFKNSTVVKTLKETGGNVIEGLKTTWDNIKNSTAVKTVSEKGSAAINTLKGAWDTIKNSKAVKTVSETGSTAINTLKTTWSAIKNSTAVKTVSEKGSSAINTLKGTWDAIKNSTAVKTLSNKWDNWTTWEARKNEYNNKVTNSTATKSLASKWADGTKWDRDIEEYNAVKDKTATVTLKSVNKVASMNGRYEILLNEKGGAFYGGKWHDIAQYATGGVPNHGSLFMAGEAGAEIVGHVGGRTEVLNQSQIASTIAAATQMSNASQNSILVQLLNVAQQIYEGQGDVRAYIPAGEVVSGLQRNNRRDGRALVPMGV